MSSVRSNKSSDTLAERSQKIIMSQKVERKTDVIFTHCSLSTVNYMCDELMQREFTI